MLIRYAVGSVHQQPGKPNWFCAYTAGKKRYFRSTKASDKKQALIICRRWEQTAKKVAAGKLTPDAARKVISDGIEEMFLDAGADGMPKATVREWAVRWLESKAIENKLSTHTRYKSAVERFLVYLGKVADRDLDHLTSTQIEGFRNHVAASLSDSSANTDLKILRAMMARAVGKKLIQQNPASAAFVKIIDRGTNGKRRRPLTIAEIKRVYAKADTEWKGMILMGLYSGQRLGDISKVTWRAVDFENDQIAMTTQKTGRLISLPMAKPLREYLQGLPAIDDPDGFIFPRAASARATGHLSNSFSDLLSETGLVQPVSHRSSGKGRGAKRVMNDVSFHSLRHSAVTFLKASGASDVLAREIVGHESAAVSRSYTHLDPEDLRPAIDKLPDVTVK
jgi:integrase